jgi:uncharacterized protein (DUF302 family)
MTPEATMRPFLLLCLISLASIPFATAGGIYSKTVNMDFDTAYKKVYAALEENRFYVIHEIDMGDSLARFKDKWDDYNLNKLEQQKIMIICNGWYANQVGNADTNMLALCPMRVTLIHKQGATTALFARPSIFAGDSKALPILQEIDGAVTGAIEEALK